MGRSIVLERSLEVRCWRVIGQIAKAEKRKELIPVLLRAREAGGTDARDLAEHLFCEPNSRLVVAERLLNIAEAYGLVTKEERDRVFTLTETGEKAIDTDEVFVPELGTWTICASEDPLLPSPILRVDPWNEPSAFDEIKGKKRERAKERSPEDVPAWLREVVEKPITPAADAVAVCIDHLENKAEAVETNDTLSLSWNVGDGRLQLTGNLEGKKVSTELEVPARSSDQIWLTLLENEALLGLWDRNRHKLRVSFDETDETEREAMVRDLRFESPTVPDYGMFDPLTVTAVPITAKSPADAQSWAKWRLRARIRDYATSERYAAWCDEAASPFDRNELALPTRKKLAQESRNLTTSRPEPRIWHLNAAEDWGL